MRPLDRKFYDAFTAAGLTQLVQESTKFPSGNILDLFLLTHEERFGDCTVMDPIHPGCGHCPVIMKYVFQDSSRFEEDGEVAAIRLWNRGKYNLMASCLQIVDWEEELYMLSPNEQYNRFLQIINPMVRKFIPTVTPCSNRRAPWSVNPPRGMKQNKAAAWTQFKNTRREFGRGHHRTEAAWDSFIEASNSVKFFAINSQKEYEKKIAEQLSTMPKLFHSYVRQKRVARPSIGPIKMNSGEITDDPIKMANCFAESFSSVYVDSVPLDEFPHLSITGTMGGVTVDPIAVTEVINSIDANSSPGADGIHPKLLKSLVGELSTPLSIIFNNSLMTGVLPDSWTTSVIVPIYKKCSRFVPLNYQPVSLTSVPCKIMERTLARYLWDYIEEFDLIDGNQFGFRYQHSTTDQLLSTYNYITNAIDRGRIVDLVFFDYSKAFDVVSQQVLLRKLFYLGIRGQLLNWISDFLLRRTMQVRVAGRLSTPCQVKSGVPQGSVLGPILFLLYINQVVRELSCQYKIFADDIKLYLCYELDAVDSSTEVLQEDINTMVNTSESWNLKVNLDKCVVMRFSPRNCRLPHSGVSPYQVRGTYLQFTQSHVDLGVVVDRTAKFHTHIRKRVAVAGAITTNLLSSTLCREAEFLMNVYTSHVRPQLEYGSPLWNMGYIGDLQLVERIQRRWTREVAGIGHLPYSERLKSLDLYSMCGRLLRSDLILVWKIFNNSCAINPTDMFELSHGRATRGHHLKIRVQQCRLETRKRFFSNRVVEAWNALSPAAVQADTVNTFKAYLHRELGEQLYNFY